jgi:hypothetical protein
LKLEMDSACMLCPRGICLVLFAARRCLTL